MPRSTDTLMALLTANDIVVYLRNCEVGYLSTLPATFDFQYGAALLWLKGQHMSRREKTEADGNSPAAALEAAIALAYAQGMPELKGDDSP